MYTALAATAIAFVFGVPLVYFLARRDFSGKGIVESIIDIPIIIPHTVAGIALLTVFGSHGLIGDPLSSIIRFRDALPGVVVAMLFVSVPFLINFVEAVSSYSAGEPVRVCLRPVDVFVSVGAAASEIERGDRDHRESSVRNAFHGTVTQMMPYGALTRVKIDCGVVVVALITKQSTAAMGLTAGSSVCVSFKAAAVHVIG